MLLILIDILERLLAWLKPFTGQKGSTALKDAQVEFQRQAHTPQDVQSFFQKLCSGQDNTKPWVSAVVAESFSGNLIIGTLNAPAQANKKIWEELSIYCGPDYEVRNV